MFKLAVIIPCYNYAQFVGEAISSVLSQGRADCELVVVDDGSIDGSWDIIKKTGARSFRITNRGARLACIFGLDQTTAPFVIFLDADDKLKPGSIATIIDSLDSSVAKFQFSLTKINSAGAVIGEPHPKLQDFRLREEIVREVLRTGVYRCPPTSGNVFRRDVCDILRSSEYEHFVDGVTLFAAPFFGDIVSVSKELGFYRLHGKNDSGLGSQPQVELLKRDLDRFESRMLHLKRIIKDRRHIDASFDIRDVYFYLERSFYLQIAGGYRPATKHYRRLILRLVQETTPVVSKFKLFVVFTVLLLAPNGFANDLIAFRFSSGSRSLLELMKVRFSK